MAEEAIIVQGATCKCKFGNAPDKIKIISHAKEYANDGKLIATTKEVGSSTLQANTFGSCNLQRNRPCKPAITEWQQFYKEVTLSNGGQILTIKSKGICSVAGSPCIEFTDDGQIENISQQSFENTDPDTQAQLNPLVDSEMMKYPEFKITGITLKSDSK